MRDADGRSLKSHICPDGQTPDCVKDALALVLHPVVLELVDRGVVVLSRIHVHVPGRIIVRPETKVIP